MWMAARLLLRGITPTSSSFHVRYAVANALIGQSFDVFPLDSEFMSVFKEGEDMNEDTRSNLVMKAFTNLHGGWGIIRTKAGFSAPGNVVARELEIGPALNSSMDCYPYRMLQRAKDLWVLFVFSTTHKERSTTGTVQVSPANTKKEITTTPYNPHLIKVLEEHVLRKDEKIHDPNLPLLFVEEKTFGRTKRSRTKPDALCGWSWHPLSDSQANSTNIPMTPPLVGYARGCKFHADHWLTFGSTKSCVFRDCSNLTVLNRAKHTAILGGHVMSIHRPTSSVLLGCHQVTIRSPKDSVFYMVSGNSDYGYNEDDAGVVNNKHLIKNQNVPGLLVRR